MPVLERTGQQRVAPVELFQRQLDLSYKVTKLQSYRVAHGLRLYLTRDPRKLQNFKATKCRWSSLSLCSPHLCEREVAGRAQQRALEPPLFWRLLRSVWLRQLYG